jgi:hypothetical protein
MAEEKLINGCPPATQDITINLKNRQYAIDNANYGPLTPALPNNGFWGKKAKMWNISIPEVKKARCKNCAAFVVSPDMLSCIEKGLGDEPMSSAWDIINTAQLGYCEIFDFKCAGDRTCDAWVTGGPITKNASKTEETESGDE